MEASGAHVFTVAATNTPAAVERAYPHVRPLRSLRLALGIHPLQAATQCSPREWSRFETNLTRTSYVGEIGLDFTTEGNPTRAVQIALFRRILAVLRRQPKFATVHSRRAETAVLDVLEETGVSPVVLHWFCGSHSQVERALLGGHAFSVNPAMLRSATGRAVIQRLPRDRVLTETHGPFVSIAAAPARPGEVASVIDHLAGAWGLSADEVRHQIATNMQRLVPTARPHLPPAER